MQEVVIGGWTDGQGRRQGTIGALLLGIPDPDGSGLRYVGQVGTGFTGPVLRDLERRLDRIRQDRSPFTAGDGVPREHARNAHWVSPTIVGEVAFAESTHDDVLRQPLLARLPPRQDTRRRTPRLGMTEAAVVGKT